MDGVGRNLLEVYIYIFFTFPNKTFLEFVLQINVIFERSVPKNLLPSDLRIRFLDAISHWSLEECSLARKTLSMFAWLSSLNVGSRCR